MSDRDHDIPEHGTALYDLEMTPWSAVHMFNIQTLLERAFALNSPFLSIDGGYFLVLFMFL